MANNLPTEKKIMAVAMLGEGNSIRSIKQKGSGLTIDREKGQVLLLTVSRADADEPQTLATHVRHLGLRSVNRKL